MRRFFVQKLPTWLLGTLLTACVGAAVASGFTLSGTIPSSSLAAFCVSGLSCAILTLLCYSRKTVRAGIACGAVLAALLVIYANEIQLLTKETEHSLFLFLLIFVLTSLLLQQLGRTRAGIVVLFLTGSCVIAGARFLEFPVPMWSCILFPAASGGMFLYRASALGRQNAQFGAGKRFAGQGLLAALAALLLAYSIFGAVIYPLRPPTQELRLITRLQSMELLQRLGVSSVKTVFDPTLTAQKDPERTEYDSPQLPPDPSEQTDNRSDVPEEQMPPEAIPAEAIQYKLGHLSPLWLLLLIPVLICAAYLGRLCYKRHWQKRLQALSPENAILQYYGFFLSRFRRMGLLRQSFHTLREYEAAFPQRLEDFSVEAATFSSLTEIYERILYGGQAATEEERERFQLFYEAFYRNARKQLGAPAYYLRVFQF